MNRKTFCTLGLMFFSLALPSLLSAQNLILDGGFDSGSIVTWRKAVNVYGFWTGVSGPYGWTLVEINSNKMLSANGKAFSRGSFLDRGKRIYQEVSGKAVLAGKYTLKFKCQCDPRLLDYGFMEVAVAQRTGAVEDVVVHLTEAPSNAVPGGCKILAEKKLLTGQQSDITAPGSWRNVEMTFEVPAAGKALLVMFSGMVDTGTLQIDDVSLTRKGGSPVLPETATVNPRSIIRPLEAPVAKPAVAAVPKPVPAPAATFAPAVAAEPAVVKPQPAEPVAPVAAPAVVTQAPVARPVFVPVHPPVDNLILSGDFSAASLALPTATGDTTAELSGRWIRSVTFPWEISPYGGNLGPYVRAAASQEAGRLLYVASDVKRSKGSYQLRFDYILTNPSDVLGVKVFVSDSDITVGTDGGDFRMNGSQRSADMTLLPASASWAAYALPVELGGGYNYIYVLFTGSGAGNTGIDNVSLAPRRR